MADKTTKIHQRYKLQNGNEVPGVTTVIGILDKPALLHWAWEQGKAGLDLYKTRDKAASIGTIAHYLCECELKGEKPMLDEYSKSDIDKAETSFLAFLEFRKNNELTMIGSELQLVSEQYRYGGTIDIYGQMKDKKVLLDLKTSSGVYPEMRLQLSAYRQLLIENGQQVDSCQLLRIDKETGEFVHYTFDDLSAEWSMFQAMLPVYELKKQIWKKK